MENGTVMSTDRKKNTPKTHPADCGAFFGHDPHLYLTPTGKTKACDGSIAKRTN